MALLKIVWRNPKPVCHYQRWEQLKDEPRLSLYLIRVFVPLDNGGYWSPTSHLEVVRGGRAA